MKDVFFVNSFKGWGGGEKWHLNAAKSVSDDFNVSVITSPGSQLAMRSADAGITTHLVRISNLSFLNPIKIITLYRLFRKANDPVVVLNLPSDFKLAGIAAWLAGVNKIIYRRGMPKPIKNTFLNRFLFGKVVTGVIVNSREIGRSLTAINEGMVAKSKVHLLYNGVDISDYQGAFSESPGFRKKDGFVLATVGRMVEQKNQFLLLDMVVQLKSSGYPVTLYIAGDGPLKSEMERLIKERELQNDVVLLGFVKDSRSLLAGADVFVFPSHYEGSANSVVEAMAMGVPVVAFDVSSMPEMVVDGETGLLATYNDALDFSQKVAQLLSDAGLRSTMGQAASRRVEEQFSASRGVALLKKILA